MLNRSKIDWPFQPLYALHPAIGCPRNCFDGRCWAKKTNDRLKVISKSTGKHFSGWVEDFSEVKAFPNFDIDLANFSVQKPSYIWVGSRSDISFWPDRYLDVVINAISVYKNHKFLFLTKDPGVYIKHKWPDNVMLGATITGAERISIQLMKINQLLTPASASTSASVFLSIEPLLGTVAPFKHVPDTNIIGNVIVGAMSGRAATKPKKEWIDSIKDQVPEERIYWKKNIRKYLEV